MTQPDLALPRPLRLALAAASGALIGLAFAPFNIWPAALLGVALFVCTMAGRTAGASFGYGYLAGLAMNAVTISWIGVLGWYVAVGLLGFMSLWFGVLGWATSRVLRLRWWPAWVACCWVAVEFASGRVPFGGFSWNRLAYTSADQPMAGFLPWIGSVGVSWLVAATGALVAWGVLHHERGRGWRFAVAGTVVASFVAGGLLQLVPVAEGGPDQVAVGMVQGNVDGVGHGNVGYARSVTNNHLSETITLMARVRTGELAEPDFVVWPENSTDIDPTLDQPTRDLVQSAALLADLPIFVGAVMFGPGEDERQTTGLWWDPDTGAGERYDKRNLVPFGEWIPFRDVLLPRLPILKQIGRQGVPGTEPGVITGPVERHPGLRVGDVICFELAYDETVLDVVRHGAQVVVVQSNNATYTGTAQPWQQFAITRVRAMELGREFVVSTTSSLSALVLPTGEVVNRTREATAASDVYTVPLRDNRTLASRLQPGLPIALVVVALLALAATWVPPLARRYSDDR